MTTTVPPGSVGNGFKNNNGKGSSAVVFQSARQRRRVYGFSTPTNYADDVDEEAMTIAVVAEAFAEGTTSHGIPHVYHANGLCKKIFWICISLASLGALTYHLYWLLSGYLKYDITTNANLVSKPILSFPAVTICNNNMIRQSHVDDLDGGRALIASAKQSDDLGSLLEVLHTRFANQDEETRRNVGHQLNDTLIYCDFNGFACTIEHFSYFYDTQLGNCYTFNSPNANMTSLYYGNDTEVFTRRAGQRYGLTLELNVEQYEYIPFLTEASGARVLIHHPHDMPFPSDQALSMGPNSLVNVALHEVIYERQGLPYGNCTPTDEENIENVYKQYFPVKYTKKACQNTCIQRETVKECGCFTPDVPYSSSVFSDVGTPSGPCTQSKTDVECSYKVWDLFAEGTISCAHCYDPCRSTMYETKVTSIGWPAPSFLNDYLSYVEASHPLTAFILEELYSDQPNIEKAVRENFLKLEIYFDSMATTEKEEAPKYDDYQFVSDLGGSFGLWVGWSALTIFEMFELATDLVVFACIKVTANRSKRRTNIVKVGTS